MMNKLLQTIISISILLCYMGCYAATEKLYGVTYDNNGNVLENVSIAVNGEWVDKSDEKGAYSLPFNFINRSADPDLDNHFYTVVTYGKKGYIDFYKSVRYPFPDECNVSLVSESMCEPIPSFDASQGFHYESERSGVRITIPAYSFDYQEEGRFYMGRVKAKVYVAKTLAPFTNIIPYGNVYRDFGGKCGNYIGVFYVRFYAEDSKELLLRNEIYVTLPSERSGYAVLSHFDKDLMTWRYKGPVEYDHVDFSYDMRLKQTGLYSCNRYKGEVFREYAYYLNGQDNKPLSHGVLKVQYNNATAYSYANKDGKGIFYLPFGYNTSPGSFNVEFDGIQFEQLDSHENKSIKYFVHPAELERVIRRYGEVKFYETRLDGYLPPEGSVCRLVVKYSLDSLLIACSQLERKQLGWMILNGVLVVLLLCALVLISRDKYKEYVSSKYRSSGGFDNELRLIAQVLKLSPGFSDRQKELIVKYRELRCPCWFKWEEKELNARTIEIVDKYRWVITSVSDRNDLISHLNKTLTGNDPLNLVHLLFKLAIEDDGIKRDEWDVLNRIMVDLKLSQKNVDFMKRYYGPLRTEFEESEKRDQSSEKRAVPSEDVTLTAEYTLLGIPVGSSKEEIKRAYRQLAMEYHPDLPKNATRHTECVRKMAEINLAYDRLMKG